MNPIWNPSDELLTRFLRGDCSPDETRAIHAWIEAAPSHARRLEGLRRLIGADGAPACDVDRMWQRVRAETIDADAPHPVPRLHRRRMVPFATPAPWRVLVAAAVLIGFVGAGVWLDRRETTPPSLPTRPDVVYATRKGQSATVQLSDGSHVQLAPQSRLSIPVAFGDGARELRLEGEAVFDVHHDAARPFRVSTRNAVTEDIGTRFGIRAYREDPKVTVVVAEGAVTLGNSHRGGSRTGAEGVLLRRGDRGTLDAGGTLELTRGAAVDRALSWTHGTLVFTKERLPEVLAAIGRWYDLEIVVADPELAKHPVTAEFSSQSPEEMLDALALAVEARVERKGRRVVLRSR